MTNQLNGKESNKMPWKLIGQVFLVIVAIILIIVFGWQVKSISILGVGLEPPAISSTSTPEKSSYTVMLPANTPWFDTGIIISAGQNLSISASGRVIMTSVNETKFSPNGQDEFGNPPVICETFRNSPCLVDRAPYVFLVAKIDENKPFQVGSNFDNIIQTTGTIFLALNDNIDYYIDNHGEIEVKLIIK